MQGQLRGEPLSFVVETECAHCGQPLSVELDSELNYRVVEAGALPLIFAPMVDLAQVDEPSIIEAF